MYIPLPLGTTATEAASRVRGWIETILDYAKTRACRGGDRRGHLDKMPPKKAKVAPVVHHAAMPYSQIAMFMSKLGEQDEDQGMRALELPIVTASRSLKCSSQGNVVRVRSRQSAVDDARRAHEGGQ